MDQVRELELERQQEHEHEPEPDAGRDVWYRRAMRGAVAGFAGTALMSLVQWPLAVASAEDPPPVEISDRLHRLVRRHRPTRAAVVSRATLLHFAFGTATGALYGALAPRTHREATGIAYASLIGAASYLGVLPIAGLHPPAHLDDPLRQVGNAAAHVVFGLSLAEGMRLTA